MNRPKSVAAEQPRIRTSSPPPPARHPVDLQVGARLRQRRLLLGMSQKRLGEAIGVSFQQVQKYERGASRISASSLYDLSRALEVPITFFFDPSDDGGEGKDAPESAEARLVKREMLELARAFGRLSDPDVRSKICDLVKVLAAAAGGGTPGLH
jgi:transcriptional regulator with XRE-family HTH domain